MIKENSFSIIRSNLTDLLSQLSEIFSEDERNEVEEFLSACEYGISLETVYFIILEENKSITKTIHDKIRILTLLMDIDQIDLDKLESQVID